MKNAPRPPRHFRLVLTIDGTDYRLGRSPTARAAGRFPEQGRASRGRGDRPARLKREEQTRQAKACEREAGVGCGSFGATIGDDPLLDGTAPGVTASQSSRGCRRRHGFCRLVPPGDGVAALLPAPLGRVVRECLSYSHPGASRGAKGGRPGSAGALWLRTKLRDAATYHIGGRTGRAGRTRPPPVLKSSQRAYSKCTGGGSSPLLYTRSEGSPVRPKVGPPGPPGRPHPRSRAPAAHKAGGGGGLPVRIYILYNRT